LAFFFSFSHDFLILFHVEKTGLRVSLLQDFIVCQVGNLVNKIRDMPILNAAAGSSSLVVSICCSSSDQIIGKPLVQWEEIEWEDMDNELLWFFYRVSHPAVDEQFLYNFAHR
jgi:hypothetical protein